MLQRGDVLIVVSNSGDTEEVVRIIPWVKRLDIPLVAITGDAASTITRLSDVALVVNVEEACPYNMVPTSSTTATLAHVAALAIAVMESARLQGGRLRLSHPGGSLGGSSFSGWRTSCTQRVPPRSVFVDVHEGRILEISRRGLASPGSTTEIDF